MIKKLVHFSDLHIKLFKDHEHYKNILNDCLNQWKDISPDRIVFTGDLVHSKNQMTPELIDMVTWVLTECSKIAKTLVLIGNHDFLENNMERMDALSPIINMMNNDNVVYLKEGGVLEDDNIMWVIYSLTDHNKKPNIPQSDKMKIGLFHGPIQGATTDMGFAFDDGYDTNQFSGCDIVLAGDIHKRQIFDIPNGNKAYMIGSLIQQNFGENVTEHGYGVYDVESNIYEFFDVENTSPYLNFIIKDIKDITEENETLINY